MSTYPSPAPPDQPQQPTRTRLWFAVLVFLLLSMVCLAAVVLVFSGGRLPDLGQADSWTPPPVGSAAPTIAIAPADGDGLAVGAVVRIVSGGPVNLRLSPGFQNKPASDVIAAVQAGQSGPIVGGPVEADGLLWWQVRFGDREGWMAERSSSGVTLLARSP